MNYNKELQNELKILECRYLITSLLKDAANNKFIRTTNGFAPYIFSKGFGVGGVSIHIKEYDVRNCMRISNICSNLFEQDESPYQSLVLCGYLGAYKLIKSRSIANYIESDTDEKVFSQIQSLDGICEFMNTINSKANNFARDPISYFDKEIERYAYSLMNLINSS